jgi:hypothetical protein
MQLAKASSESESRYSPHLEYQVIAEHHTEWIMPDAPLRVGMFVVQQEAV